MKGLEIHDARPDRVLAFDLRDILAVLGERGRALSWECRNVECTGSGAASLHDLSDGYAHVDGATLVRLAEAVDQVIDGEFVGRSIFGGSPEVIVRALDSTFWEVFADSNVLTAIRRRFSDVRPAVYDADD